MVNYLWNENIIPNFREIVGGSLEAALFVNINIVSKI